MSGFVCSHASASKVGASKVTADPLLVCSQGLSRMRDQGFVSLLAGCRPARNLMSPNGPKAIEDFKVGDPITSRNEFEPGGEIEINYVEEVFRRSAPILHLHVGGPGDPYDWRTSVFRVQ